MEERTLSDLGHSQEPQFVSSDNRARPKVPRLKPSAVSWWWDILPRSFSPFPSMFLKDVKEKPLMDGLHATIGNTVSHRCCSDASHAGPVPLRGQGCTSQMSDGDGSKHMTLITAEHPESPRGARWDPGARLQMPVFTIRHLRALSTESSSAG
ncbi:unnamed protein product [Boreogadus saida]